MRLQNSDKSVGTCSLWTIPTKPLDQNQNELAARSQ